MNEDLIGSVSFSVDLCSFLESGMETIVAINLEVIISLTLTIKV